MAMVDFFIENKGIFFPYHYITYGNKHALVVYHENGSIMKSIAMSNFFIETKGTFFPYHYISYGNKHAMVIICENGSIMKSMAMVDFFIENKGKLHLKQQDIVNQTKICENGSIMKSWLWSTSSLKIKTRLWSICENGSIMKSMAMVDRFIENKGTFYLYHYITYGNRHALVRILRKWVDNEIHGYGRASSLKIKILRNGVDNEIHGYGRSSFIENKGRFGPDSENGSIMRSMAMVNFFIENKGNFLPISLHYLWKQTRLGPRSQAKNGLIMKSMAMVDFFIENKETFFLYHYITYGNRHALVPDSLKWVDKEIHGYGLTSSLKNKGTFFPYHYITYGNKRFLVHVCENGSIMKSIALIDFFIEIKGKLQLKQQDIVNGTKKSEKELSSHIITLPMETNTLRSRLRNGLIMKSMAINSTSSLKIKELSSQISLHYLRKQTRFGPSSAKNGSIMKSMSMVDLFIEKRNFLPISLHYLWKQTRFGPRYHLKWVDKRNPWLWSTSSLKIKELSSHIITFLLKQTYHGPDLAKMGR
ncbi:hypothetical protein H6P81_021551 [Aristolochia fimbriata]|uniref:Uncharacterized protein n=1 Tax=Aristolochia fimbriata TaxID=158543 RepID=A0AAV7DR79_ARIFI|nr:hypothetical protein H6P81_021551 [Aristolochia fimbriata]